MSLNKLGSFPALLCSQTKNLRVNKASSLAPCKARRASAGCRLEWDAFLTPQKWPLAAGRYNPAKGS